MKLFGDPGERFARELRAAEDRLRVAGLHGRQAFVALVRHLARRLGVPPSLWPDGPDAPPSARLDALPLAADLDLFGLAYERFFTDLFKGARGQYFTPRPLVELVADLAQVRPGDRVLDPTCGSGGFLVAALARGADVDGVEVDPDLAALARLNLALHGADPRAVAVADFFREPPEDRWDVILANPPFSVEVRDPEVLRRHGVARDRASSDALFLEAALGCLRPGGRLATVLPYSLLANPAHAELRARVDAVAVREAVVSLPEGVFRPFGGTPTRAAVVVLRRRPAPVGPVLAAVIAHPGYDPRRRAFRRTAPDDLAALRVHLRGGAPFARARRVEGAGWIPEEVVEGDAVAPGVPTFRLAERARPVQGTRAVDPDETYTVLEFAHVDKGTGEVVAADVRPGSACASATRLEEGELLFGRMRPALNNVTRARRPRPDMPAALAGSGEWVRFAADAHAEFLLLAMRSSFARAQLAVTGGQTRPRARTEDIAAMRLPDPGDDARAAMDALLSEVRAERARLRAVLDDVAALYEAFGRGEIGVEELLAAVRELR